MRKAPEDRPADAATLRQQLLSCPEVVPWTQADAQEWWAAHGAELTEVGESLRNQPDGPLWSNSSPLLPGQDRDEGSPPRPAGEPLTVRIDLDGRLDKKRR